MSNPEAIEGAEYYDETYDQQCTVESVRDTNDGIVVDLEYEHLGQMTVSLATFERSEGFQLLDIPDN